MSTHELAAREPQRVGTARRLLLVWQNPVTRTFVRVGELGELLDGRYMFSYLESASADPDFFPLDEFPDIERSYITEGLPGFFANRVMSNQRDSYSAYRSWLDLSGDGADAPVEVLARTGGGRATDTFHVVDVPGVTQGRFESRFFVSGLRHIEDSASRVAGLSVGAELGLRPEPENPINPDAVLVDVQAGVPVGWVPDWLVGELRELRRSGHALRCFVERVNQEAPPHLRLLVRLESSHDQVPTD